MVADFTPQDGLPIRPLWVALVIFALRKNLTVGEVCGPARRRRFERARSGRIGNPSYGFMQTNWGGKNRGAEVTMEWDRIGSELAAPPFSVLPFSVAAGL